MRICVYGAGAVGGHIAGRLAAGGQDVSVVARGAHLAAIRRDGLRVITRDGALHSRPTATDRAADLPPQDLVVVALKAHTLPAIADDLAGLLDGGGRALFVSNGVPWWYFHGVEGALGDARMPRLDPHGALWTRVRPERSFGAVAYTAGTLVEPGTIRAENARNRLVVGRPDGADEPLLDAFADLLRPSGLDVETTPRIRDAIWRKLVSNVVGGSLGALTASPGKDIFAAPAVAGFAASLAREVVAIARAVGSEPGPPEPALAGLAASGHVQSLAQDLLAGRAMEVDALLRAPLDLARMREVPVPQLELVVELVIQRARAAGAYDDGGVRP